MFSGIVQNRTVMCPSENKCRWACTNPSIKEEKWEGNSEVATGSLAFPKSDIPSGCWWSIVAGAFQACRRMETYERDCRDSSFCHLCTNGSKKSVSCSQTDINQLSQPRWRSNNRVLDSLLSCWFLGFPFWDIHEVTLFVLFLFSSAGGGIMCSPLLFSNALLEGQLSIRDFLAVRRS